MRTVDWLVLLVTLVSIIIYGIVKGRGSRNVEGYLMADRRMPWYAVWFSIMATQASAITFTSTPGQAYTDGMRFVQFYFGLPIAMVILSITAVPIYHKLGVYTAYEYIEHRFDLKTRTLTSILFLIQRGLGAGMTVYAPSLILSVMLGIDIRITSAVIGGVVIISTSIGGVKTVTWTHFWQMLVIMLGMAVAFVMALLLLPKGINFGDALHIAGGMGKLNVLDFSFDISNRYTFWSGLIGGLFVALAYFGTDQSQVQRYLTGSSVGQSRLGLLLNGMTKVPMQFFILLIGAMVFVFYQFVAPPLFFNPVETKKIYASDQAKRYESLETEYRRTFEEKEQEVSAYLAARNAGNTAAVGEAKAALERSEKRAGEIRTAAIGVLKENDPATDTNDTNYIFLSFVMKYLPAGLVGLVLACILAASMTSTSGELSALATCSVIDIYRRHYRNNASEKHYLVVSRVAMIFWGVYAIFFSHIASSLGSLVEAVNILGSLFYGTLLGIFLIAFYLKWIKATPTFIAAFVGEICVFLCFRFTNISWLWYNVVGCVVVVATAMILQLFASKPGAS